MARGFARVRLVFNKGGGAASVCASFFNYGYAVEVFVVEDSANGSEGPCVLVVLPGEHENDLFYGAVSLADSLIYYAQTELSLLASSPALPDLRDLHDLSADAVYPKP
ncbi:hypothetical protein BDQ12DRAFT_692867 [Crucibulum laeve]|uniref:Uncharacterized protein n=1 Tax=Crucibulum laeve TaxID=68775 RepID=A0A5C3LHN0_9AGAR|nr:hypothetical protein BDQ12DRAFT_692867 [Crucibulum laeve]